jgi:hypothetical protein
MSYSMSSKRTYDWDGGLERKLNAATGRVQDAEDRLRLAKAAAHEALLNWLRSIKSARKGY